MRLGELCRDIISTGGGDFFEDREICAISTDSREAGPGVLFVAVPGARAHGRDFIADALARGAAAIVGNAADISACSDNQDGMLSVADPQATLVRLLQRFYGYDVGRIKLYGITGTNGKTTITYLLESILAAAGRRVGVIGTVSHRVAGRKFTAKNTTPGLVENYRLLQAMLAEHADTCVMEVSSHALEQGRVAGLEFAAAIFTNLTRDHLDYHHDMDDYFQAKAKLFLGLVPGAVAIINGDCPYGRRLLAMSPAAKIVYGIDGEANLRARDLTLSSQGTRFAVSWQGQEFQLTSPLIGRHNVYNLLAATALALSEGLDFSLIQRGIKALNVVPGRLQRIVGDRDFSVFVDYAHTDDALTNVLSSLRNLAPRRILLVFGCGGDRDRGKRPKMGRVASSLADHCIITNDNPRSEDPGVIAKAIEGGFDRKNYEVILDRQEAIRRAIQLAGTGDIVLVAGKGHEDYQIFHDKTVPFDEVKIITAILSEKAATGEGHVDN